MLEEEVAVKLAEHEHDIAECKRRIEKVESTSENINKLALSVERLAVSVAVIAKSQEEELKEQKKICKRIDTIEKQPLVAARNLKNEVIRAIAAAVAGGIVGYLISLLT